MNGGASRIRADEFSLVRPNISIRIRPERVIYNTPDCGAGVQTMEHIINEGPVRSFGRVCARLDRSVEKWMCVAFGSDYFSKQSI